MMQVVNPPHSLEELLAVMAVKDEINVGAIDQAITSSPWTDKFRAYLRRMKLEDDENILKFLILVQVLNIRNTTWFTKKYKLVNFLILWFFFN